jgi:hypothetical protein
MVSLELAPVGEAGQDWLTISQQTMSWTPKLGIALVGIAVAVIVVGLCDREQIQRLPDGSTLYLHKVKVGLTNESLHGTALEKLLGRIIPAKGVSIWKYHLSRPTKLSTYSSAEVSGLSAEFRLGLGGLGKGPGSIARRPAFPRTLRWVLTADDDIPYVQEFWEWRQQKDGLFTSFSTSLFPRQKRRLSIRLEECDMGSGDWRQLADFVVPNPRTAQVQPWMAPPAPATKRIADLEFTLGESTFALEPRNTNDIWVCQAKFPFQVKRNGVVETNWSADYFVLEDASGNRDRTGAMKTTTTNGWLDYETWRSPDPEYVWRINLDFGLDSGWKPTNICQVKLAIPWQGPIKTNFNGVPVGIDFVNGDMLAVNIPTNRTDLRLTFLGANDGGGPFRTGSWSQHQFWQKLELPRDGGSIEATFTIGRNYHVEFYTKPVWLRPGATNTASVQPHP